MNCASLSTENDPIFSETLFSEEGVKFTGKEWDDDAGLYYYNARWYDANSGRFTSEDPIRDGLNYYVYVNNNPVNFVDPTGLAQVVSSWEGEETTEYEFEGSDAQSREELVTAQDEAMDKPEYQPDEYTYCNKATYDVVEETTDAIEVLTEEEHRGNRYANEAANSLANTQATPSTNYGKATELSGQEAQKAANKGQTVVAAWKNPKGGSGHLATVRPTEEAYDPQSGPLIANVGSKMGVMPTVQGFGARNLQDTKYYLLDSE